MSRSAGLREIRPNQFMKNIIFTVLYLLVLAGCNSEEREARKRQEKRDKTFSTTSYNYTPDALYSITFQDVSLPFKIDEASDGGSIFIRPGNKKKMDNGEEVSFSSDKCCFIWSGPVDKPIRVRVVWNVIYDTNYQRGEGNEDYDERTSRKSAPGTRWCQAIVDILPMTGPERPRMVFLHFFRDGSVQGQLGTYKTEKPLASEYVKKYSAPLPEGQVCRQEIDNPFYGIPRTPHRE